MKCLECPSTLSAQVPGCLKCPSALSVRVTSTLSARVPKCPPSGRVSSKCPSALWVLSEYPSAWVLSEYLKYSSALWVSLNTRDWMFNQMWLEQNAKHKNMILVKRNAKNKKKLWSLILKQCQSANLKSFWNRFVISDLCKGFCKILLLCGHLYKELNDGWH